MGASAFESLADYMREMKVSDETLAARLKVSRPYVTRLRQRKRRPSLELAIRLEKMTGIPAAKFAETTPTGA